MKSYTNSDEVIGAARKAQEMLNDLDNLLYTLDGEIPNDDANLAVKKVRDDLNEATKTLGYLASGMWRASHQETAHEWFERERCFAEDAHEMTLDLTRKVDAILNGPSTSDHITDDQWRHAAQLIACYRNTCGGPNAAHQHILHGLENA